MPSGINYGPGDDRLAGKFEVSQTLFHDGTPCWLWLGALSSGYGKMRNGGRTLIYAHRKSYEQHIGPIPEGLELDHLCRRRACINPAHLEPVTTLINQLRGDTLTAKNLAKTHCVNGHPFHGDNLIIINSRWRRCRACWRETRARFLLRHPTGKVEKAA